MTALMNPNLLVKRIAVLMGGSSSEREISLRSGYAVLEALQGAGLHVTAVDLAEDTTLWHQQIEAVQPDMAFIALHGTYGEDGCIQALLETMKISYTGSEVLASAVCMNKKLTKTLLDAEGIVTPKTSKLIDGAPLTYPVFVKPVSEGSSVGLHYVEDQQAWEALDLNHHQRWLIEECVVGKEIAVSVLNGKALTPVEIAPKSGMYDYESKYTTGATDYYCPAHLSEDVMQQCKAIAAQAVAVLGCKGAPRVDLIVPEIGQPVVLEVNTIPGMTATSLLPKAAAQEGMDFTTLCAAILESVLMEDES